MLEINRVYIHSDRSETIKTVSVAFQVCAYLLYSDILVQQMSLQFLCLSLFRKSAHLCQIDLLNSHTV